MSEGMELGVRLAFTSDKTNCSFQKTCLFFYVKCNLCYFINFE